MKAKSTLSLIVALMLGFLFGSVLEHYLGAAMEGDVGCFDAISHQMKLGQHLYSEVYDNKAPGIFYINYLLPELGFNPITSSWILQASCFFILVFTLRPLISQWTMLNSVFGFCAAIFVVFSIRTIVFFWPAFFVGGYTEQIGTYLLISGFLLLYQSSFFWTCDKMLNPRYSKLKLLVSGLFIGLTLLIKEPFVFFIPAITLWLFFVNRKDVGLWFIGFISPWLMHAVVLIKNGSYQEYFQYLRFAVNYGNAGNNLFSVEKLLNTLQPFQFDSLPVVNVIQLFVFFVFCFLFIIRWWWNYRNKSDAPEEKRSFTLILLFTHLLFLWGSRCFGLLGNGNYLHYQIPEYLLSWLGLVLLFNSISSYLKRFRNVDNYKAGVLILGTVAILLISNSIVKKQMPMGHFSMVQTLKDPHFIHGANYPKLVKVSEEEQAWNYFLLKNKIKVPERSQIFIDDPHLGRFYGYLNSQYLTYFPCPYWVFFHMDQMESNDQLWPYLEQNRNIIIRQLQEQPPQFVIMGENKGPYATFKELIVFFEHNFVKRGEFLLDTKRVLLYERVHSKLPEDNL